MCSPSPQESVASETAGAGTELGGLEEGSPERGLQIWGDIERKRKGHCPVGNAFLKAQVLGLPYSA